MAGRIRILVFGPGAAPRLSEIETTLEAMQALVGGCVEAALVFGSVVLHTCEAGVAMDLAPCAFVDGIPNIVFGRCFVAAVDERGELRSLTDDEVVAVLKAVRPVAFVSKPRFKA